MRMKLDTHRKRNQYPKCLYPTDMFQTMRIMTLKRRRILKMTPERPPGCRPKSIVWPRNGENIRSKHANRVLRRSQDPHQMMTAIATMTPIPAYLDAFREERQDLVKGHKPLLKTPPRLPAVRTMRIPNLRTVDTRGIPHLSTRIKGHNQLRQRRMMNTVQLDHNHPPEVHLCQLQHKR